MAIKWNIDLVKEKMLEINPNIEILSNEYINNRTKLQCKCRIDGHEWDAQWSNLQLGKGCPKCCGNVKLTIEEVKDKLLIINPSITLLSTEYKNGMSKLHCKCKIDNYEWYPRWNDLRSGQGCPKCGNRPQITLDYVKVNLANISPNIEVIDNIYKNSETPLKCRCKIHNFEWNISWNNLKQRKGCPICANERATASTRYSLEYIKDLLKEINNDVEIISDNYKNNTSKLKCKCKVCNNEWKITWQSLQMGHGCSKCSQSKGEKRIYKYLKENNYIFDSQYKIDECKNERPLPFDFVVLNYENIKNLIEYDGELHYTVARYSKDKKKMLNKLKLQQYNDILKNEYCIENNIRLIRIPYWDFENIEVILDDILLNGNIDSKYIINNNKYDLVLNKQNKLAI